MASAVTTKAPLEKRLSKAKTTLILDHPFVGTIALNMPIVIVTGEMEKLIPTAATDGKQVMFNRNFCDPLTDAQLLFLVAHECMHPMLEHTFRRGTRDHYKFNAAADFVINQLLSDEGIGTFIPGGCLDKKIYEKGGGTSEGIYNILPDMPKAQQLYGVIGGKGGTPYDQILDGGRTAAENGQLAAEWKVTTAQAAQAAKMAGKLSANMERVVGEILQPKVDWRDVLRRFVEKCKNDTRTYARPNRRFLPHGMYTPSVSGEAIGEIAIAIDCSGSIDERQLNEFAAEIRAIKEDSNPLLMHVLYFDSEVCHYDRFERDDDLHIEPHGGGGTAFSPVFRYLDKIDATPVACIFLTDLYCSDFGPPTPYPTLWVSTAADKAPWGEVVMMNKQKK